MKRRESRRCFAKYVDIYEESYEDKGRQIREVFTRGHKGRQKDDCNEVEGEIEVRWQGEERREYIWRPADDDGCEGNSIMDEMKAKHDF